MLEDNFGNQTTFVAFIHQIKTVMKFYALLFALFITFSLSAQNDMMSTVAELNKKQEIVTDIDRITEYTYQTFSFDEEAKPDTVIQFDGEKVELHLGTTKITSYKSPTEIIERSIDKEGVESMVVTVKLHDDGRFVSMKTDMGDNPAAAFMNANSFREYHYDDQDRLHYVVPGRIRTG